MKKRIIGFLAALVLALVGSTLLVAFVSGAEDRALAGETVVEVWVAESEIEQGTSGENLEDLVVLERIPTKVQVEGAIADLASLDGLVAAIDVLPGEQLTIDRFIEPRSVSKYARVEQAPEGFLEMSMSLSPERVVGGSVKPGDTVALVASFDPFDQSQGTLPDGLEIVVTNEQLDTLLDRYLDSSNSDKTPSESHILQHKVLVTNVQEEELPQSTFSDDDTVETGAALAPTGNLLVTVALDAPSIERLVFAMEFGRIWLAIDPEGAPEDGTQIITWSTAYEGGNLR